jgi:hypothetical protein
MELIDNQLQQSQLGLTAGIGCWHNSWLASFVSLCHRDPFSATVSILDRAARRSVILTMLLGHRVTSQLQLVLGVPQ